ncbi:hypothetical protein MKX03_005146 [Papaver bracteatum]|nr:hypothetical protein MKX03_005146 [Papaver bracteatum]
MGTGNSVRFFILLGLLFSVVMLIASELRKRHQGKKGVQDAKYAGYQGGGGYPGNGGYQGGGGNGGRYQ